RDVHSGHRRVGAHGLLPKLQHGARCPITTATSLTWRDRTTGARRQLSGAVRPEPARVVGMDGVLRARGLVKHFRDRVAVGGIDIDVAAGERVALLGPNGAGKTTTLLMLLGAVLPDTGTIDILGHRLPGERSQAMERVGFAAGYLPLPEKLRVREVLDVFARLSGVRQPKAIV